MNKIIVKFIIGGNQFLGVAMERYQAQKMIRNYRDNKLPELIGDEEGSWSIRTSSIHGVHIEEFKQDQQQSVTPGPSGLGLPPFGNSSGWPGI